MLIMIGRLVDDLASVHRRADLIDGNRGRIDFMETFGIAGAGVI